MNQIADILRSVNNGVAKVCLAIPFIVARIAKIKVKIVPEHLKSTIPTAATDGYTLYVNSDFYFRLANLHRLGLLVHELLHIALAHSFRRFGRDPHLWNLACDYVVNLIVKDLGFELPPDAYLDEKYRGWSEARIYEDLAKGQNPDQEEGEGDTDGGGSGDDDGEDQSSTQQGGQPDEQPDEQGDGQGDEKPDEQGDEQDGGAGGNPGADPTWDSIKQVGKLLDPKHEDGTPLTEEECRKEISDAALDTEWSERMTASGSTEGFGEGAMDALDRLRNPKISWRAVMEKFLTRKGATIGKTWRRLNRRKLQRGQYARSDVREGIRILDIAYDLSSSVDRDRGRAMLDHIDKVRETFIIEKVRILPFNTAVQQGRIVRLTRNQELPREFARGGGTRFTPIFEWIDSQDEKPDALIIFTDMGAYDFPDQDPDFPVLWASTDPITAWDRERVPFGELLEIDIVDE